LLTGS